jgi:uridine kinase
VAAKLLPMGSSMSNRVFDPSSAVVIGVAGGSGSGKTTFARLLQARLGDSLCAIISQDAYYRDRHKYFDRDGGQVNFDHPDSLEFELLIHHLHELRKGHGIQIPTYDFVTHSRLPTVEAFLWRPVVIVDGILLLTQSELRPMLDFAYFIETSEDLRFQRRLKRDVLERGRTREGVQNQFYHHVKPMHDLFVEPSRKFADRIVSGERAFTPVIEEIFFGLQPALSAFLAN